MKNIFKTFDLFNYKDVDDLVGELIYYYLFSGMSLTAIEAKLFNTEVYHGWLSKSFLNYYGIDTERDNKGLYEGRIIAEVVQELYTSSEIKHIRIAKVLKQSFL